jgi:hypothetical protein
MKRLIGGLVRLVVRLAVRAVVLTVVAALVRAVIGRLTNKSGEEDSQWGSFDSWPAVPPAPEGHTARP